jgi:hypothetical protein
MRKIMVTVFSVLMALQYCHIDAYGQNGAEKAMTPEGAYEKLKGLAGDWKGTIASKNHGPEVLVSYKVTGNGSAVVETQFPDTDHEMMTVYHLDGDQLVLTHYCALGNQPRMVMNNHSSENQIGFSFAGGTNLEPDQDRHVHNGVIRFVEHDYIENEWDVFHDGTKVDVNKFYLTRIK